MDEVTAFFTRDKSGGRIHRRYRTRSGKVASLEQDNLDDAGAYTEISEADVAAAPRDALCRNCFPRPDDDPGEPGVGPI